MEDDDVDTEPPSDHGMDPSNIIIIIIIIIDM